MPFEVQQEARELRLWWGAGEASLLFNFSEAEAMAVVREAMEARLLHPGAEAALIAVYAALIASGLLCNALLCAVAARRWRRWRLRRRGGGGAGDGAALGAVGRTAPAPRDLLVVNLAVADLSLCSVCMPFTLAALISGRWALGEALCKAVPALQGFNILVSAGTIAAIAIDRYCTIVRATAATRPPSLDDGTRPLARRTQQCSSAPRCDARTRVLASVALIWLLALAAAAPVALFQQVERLAVGGVVVFEACVERWPSRSARAAYSVCVATAQFAVPAVVLAAVHARISARLRAGGGVAAPRRRCRAAARRRRHRRTTLILSAVAAVFAASWLPLTVFSLVSDLSAPRPHPIHAAAAPPQPLLPPHGLYAAFAACHVAAMTSACSNPFLYGWLNTNFRREFAEIVPGACAGRRRGEAASSGGGRRDARRTSSTLVTALSGRPATVSCLPSVSQAGRSELL